MALNNAVNFMPLSDKRLRKLPMPDGVVPDPPDFRIGQGMKLPKTVDSMVKVLFEDVGTDGNCGLRALSLYLTGTQENYPQFRAVREFMILCTIADKQYLQ